MAKKPSGGIAKTKQGKARKVGSKFTKKVTRGPNKGDTVQFTVSPSGKPFPSRIVKDVGKRSKLKGVKRSKKR